MPTKKDEETFERHHAINRRRVYSKRRKRIRWNGIEFDSQVELGRYLKLPNHKDVSGYIKRKSLLKGHLVERIKDDK